jgi:hypothetical protein
MKQEEIKPLNNAVADRQNGSSKKQMSMVSEYDKVTGINAIHVKTW